ncbi:MAG: thiolase family protein [Bergeyella sp.]|nr:thiolase family protein [Bergeyella sp.]
MKTAYIIKGYRTAVGKAPRGSLRFTRPDVMAATVIEKLMQELPQLEQNQIDDLIVGNAMPEAEQGLNVARLISLMGLNTNKVPGVTINRYCASGSEAIAIASAKIQSSMADCIIAGGTESMSYIPMGGYKPVPEVNMAKNHPDYYWGMGYTAEEVAKRYKISRQEQDEFAFDSHQKALSAMEKNVFANQVVSVPVEYNFLDENQELQTLKYDFSVDEGPMRETSLEKLARLKPVFSKDGSVTAGNSSQMSDGAAFVVIVSEEKLKELNIEPEARLVAYATAGLEPRIMGMGPVYAIPKALKQAGLNLKDIGLIELNEAFASQSVAIKKELELDPGILNVNGGAIALGHPLGCTGTKLTVQLIDEMKKRKIQYGLVSMCVGTGQGAASIIECLK